jgi:hypothetical protein
MNKRDIITEEFNNVADLIANNSLKMQQFNSFAPYLKSIRHKSRKKWSTPRTCIYPGCSSQTVKRSHAISKSNSLKNIADKGHVLQPFVDVFAPHLAVSMKSIGINTASTFPGFCEEHEELFQKYENEEIHENDFIPLQTYRSICREVVHLKIEIEIIENELSSYKHKLEQEATSIIIERLKKRGIFEKPERTEIKGVDKILIRLEKLKKEHQSRLTYLKKHSDQIIYEFLSDPPDQEVEIISKGIVIDKKIPISLCGYSSLAYENEGMNNMLFTVNIIPLKNSTYIFCSTEKPHKKPFDNITNYYFQSPLTVLSFVEAFMVYGSDHWYISPEYWESFSYEKKQVILSEIFNVDKLFTSEFEYSIFDDIRAIILDVYVEHVDDFTEADIKLVDKEKSKLSNISNYVPKTELQQIEAIEKYWNERL